MTSSIGFLDCRFQQDSRDSRDCAGDTDFKKESHLKRSKIMMPLQTSNISMMIP